MKPLQAFAVIGLALVVGLGSGYLAAGEPVTRTPHACHVMADTAMEGFQLWSDLAGATRDRGDATGSKAYDIHNAEVNHLIASLEAIAPDYDAAEAECLGVDR